MHADSRPLLVLAIDRGVACFRPDFCSGHYSLPVSPSALFQTSNIIVAVMAPAAAARYFFHSSITVGVAFACVHGRELRDHWYTSHKLFFLDLALAKRTHLNSEILIVSDRYMDRHSAAGAGSGFRIWVFNIFKG